MGSRNVLLGVAGVGALMVFVGVWSNAWWTGGASGTEVGFGLRSVSVCTSGRCVDVAYRSFGGGSMFTMFGNMTFFVGMLGVGLTLLGTYFYLFQGLGRFRRIAGYACSSVIPLSFMTMMSFPGTAQLSVGWSLPLTIVGAIAGVYAAFKDASSSWNAGEYKPAQIVREPGAVGAGSPMVDSSGLAPLPDALETPASPPPATPDASAPLPLRFLARRIELSSVGISAVLLAGGQRDLLWSDVRRVGARQLPPIAPYNGALFVDILPIPLLGRPSPPIRVGLSSHVQIEPSTGSANAEADMLRRIGLLIEQNKPGVIEPVSQPFFSSGGPPQRLANEAELTAHDEQFVGGSYGR